MDTRSIVYIALFAALTAALGLFPPLTVPGIGVPITAQTLGVMLAGSLAGARRGALAMVLFIALVAVGLPLLAGGRGGIGIFFGPTGGFAVAFPVAAFVIGALLAKAPRAGLVHSFLAIALGGIVTVYAIGIPWLSVAAGLPLGKAFIGSMAFVPGDLIKAVLAVLITRGVRRALPAL
ncbi:biotin transport system substrate-specific component [Salinihabitans flavidus]|uniref:Biotin transporter n=1 Tax=Salinihabitans flavidus TaxID=569882 RepID=A0A1H8REB8_9RHOB|nr:biotin transporter BioY [Salinihabitans flavidus]SEO64781.1 biotin transport system substrate-specific component [Salinihabitans flavidus]